MWDSWFGLATLLSNRPERAPEAEAAFRKVIEIEPKQVIAGTNSQSSCEVFPNARRMQKLITAG